MAIIDTIRALPGPRFEAFRYPHEYAIDLAVERDIVPVEHVDAGREEVRAGLRPGSKRGPETRMVLRCALRRWCEVEGEELDAVYATLADKYLALHSILKS
ncbi:hypothetical protein ACH4E7_40735 [Kitasatospora sp. NPDC018058]|uniref:hypothetical protein n=1 Tax=Kitasatospora sp. NPDC018058 TaxID=3364025 RepID=UPI0037C0BAFF